MKITFEMSGGFAHIPALSRPVITDTEHVDTRLADRLESLVQESSFFDRPPRLDTRAKGAADYRTYTITVQDGPRVHTVELTDPITDQNLDRLVSFLRNMSYPSAR
jgi:hypothetical protein